MGEIATWSAVKSKVGLGKTGNDCPTKAELLALTPTGTGESYVGLEISNASSYGNNECVKLEDIHKVTYKYTLTTIFSSISFDALGNPISSNLDFGFTSKKQKYWDGVANGSTVNVNYALSNRPSWVFNHSQPSDGRPWTASENLNLTSRSDSNTLVTQSESGKTLKLTFTQAAASQSWRYVWSVTPTSILFGATGDTKTFTVASYKQELRNGHNYGNQIALTYTRANSGSVSGSGTSVTMGNNTSTSTRSGTVTLTQAETGKKLTLSCSQSAGYRTYSEITASGGSVSDIPASGGSRSSFSSMPSYSQTWGWNGSTTGGGTITSGASISYGTAVSAGSLGITVKSRTQVGALTGTLSLNGKTKSVSVPVYQAANEITGYDYGPWSVSLTASSYTISNTGGSVTLYPSASRPRYANYTSGLSTKDGSDSATPSLSTNGTSGFSLSGTTLSASANTSTSSRSIRVTASHGGASDYVDITQGGASVSYNYYFNWGSAPGSQTSKSITHPALGKTEEVPFISYKKKVINGTETSDIYPVGASRNVPSWTTVNIVDNGLSVKTYENTVESSRSATVTVTQSESGKKITLTINQNAATITYDYVFSIS
nr:MAG TPA: Putative binding domain, N-terminal [Caudoviricetes sp.]